MQKGGDMTAGDDVLIPVVRGIVGRHTAGRPLFTVELTEEELAELRHGLRRAVAARGISALRADGICRTALAFFGSSFFATEASELSWRPLLRALGVEDDELPDYPDLYDPLELTIRERGREVIRRGRRLFLGTLLREGGLPTRIGDLARLIAAHVRSRGWPAVLDENVRDWMVDAIAGSAGGAAGTLFASEESRSALGELLSDVARTYDELIKRGVDPTTLPTASAVEAALAERGIAIPTMRSRDLLVELLGTFRDSTRAPRSSAPTPTATLLAFERDGTVVFRVAADLALLDTLAGLPSTVAISVVPGPPRPLLVQRTDGGWLEPSKNEPRVEFRLPALPLAVDLSARWSLPSGSTAVSSILTLTTPLDDVLWFGADSRLLSGALETLAAGITVVGVARVPVDVVAEGDVSVTELAVPVGFASAFTVRVGGPGTLRVVTREAEPRTSVLACGHTRFEVEVQPGATPSWTSTSRVLHRLPTFVLPEGVEADLRVTRGDNDETVVATAQRGRVIPNSISRVAAMTGRLRVAFETNDGGRWSRTWFVLPRTFGIETRGRSVLVRHDANISVASPWKMIETGTGGTVFESTEEKGEDEHCELLLRHAGQTASIVVAVPRGVLRLRRNPSAVTTESLLDTRRITEREVNLGACLELCGSEGTLLEVSIGNEMNLRVRQPTSRRTLVPLMDVLVRASRKESPLRLAFSVQDGASGEQETLTVEVPRYAKPTRLSEGVEPGSLSLRVTVDPADTPVRPALAFFAVTDPFVKPRVVEGVLSAVTDGHAVVSVPDPNGALASGQVIAFLVDAAVTPPRPMSGGSLLRARDGVEPGAEATPLQVALWQGDHARICDALKAEASGPAVDAFFDRLLEGSMRCAAYGLTWFYVYRVLSEEALWIVLAAAARLPRTERLRWLQMWKDQLEGIRWTFLTTNDAASLAATLSERARMDSADKMHLVGVANDVTRMSRATEIVLCEALFRGDSLLPVSASLRQGVPEGRTLPRDWSIVALPTGKIGVKWLKGTELDGDDQSLVETILGEQLLNGERIHALREVFGTHPVPRLPDAPTPKAPWFAPLRAALVNDWKPLSREGGMNAVVCSIELATLAFAAATFVHLMGGQPLFNRARSAVRLVEQRVPRLFEFWLNALKLLPPKDSR